MLRSKKGKKNDKSGKSKSVKRAFSEKVTFDIDFADKAVWCSTCDGDTTDRK